VQCISERVKQHPEFDNGANSICRVAAMCSGRKLWAERTLPPTAGKNRLSVGSSPNANMMLLCHHVVQLNLSSDARHSRYGGLGYSSGRSYIVKRRISFLHERFSTTSVQE
jgi:hypothetical protein